jgi:hypothetical protein
MSDMVIWSEDGLRVVGPTRRGRWVHDHRQDLGANPSGREYEYAV